MNSPINEKGQIVRWPKKPKDKNLVILWLSNKFDIDITYNEKEVNLIIDNHHTFTDTPLLRRELISRGLLSRTNNGSKYWKTIQ